MNEIRKYLRAFGIVENGECQMFLGKKEHEVV